MIRGRLAVVDGLRGFAVTAVLIYHFHLFAIDWVGTARWERLYNLVSGLGWITLDLFFVLSGFLITGILLESKNRANYYRTFYFRRTVRIFPLYYASLILFYGVGPLILLLMQRGGRIHQLIHPTSQIFAWFYVLNWRIGLYSFSQVPVFLHHFWSLSIEEQFYLGWPFVVRILTRRRLMLICPAMVLVSLLSRVLFFQLHLETAAYVLTVCRVDSLAIGAMIALAFRDDRYWRLAKTAAPWLALSASIALLAIVKWTRSTDFNTFPMGTFGISFLALLFAGVLVMALGAQPGSIVYSVTSAGLFQFFGRYSYCLYVCHQPLIICLARAGVNGDHLTALLGSKALAVLAVNAIAFLLSVFISLASWHLLEKQFLKLKDAPPRKQGGELAPA
jgi:peptidoglycan/LPS O-acetylase OafA/YrhL